MKNKLNKLLISIIIIYLIIAFNSSHVALDLSNLAIVVAMAIDTSDTNNLSVTFQFTNASSVSENGSSEQSPSIVNTVEASSISSAINLMNSYIGKELSLSHCKLIVFSEEFAKQGISEEIYTLMNDNQIRPSTNLVISKCSAKYYIENSKPMLESLITKYYEIYNNASLYTGYTTDATIGNFFNNLNCGTCEPYGILGGVNVEQNNTDTSINSEKDANSQANNLSISGSLRSENSGLAVFKDATLVGELTAIENLSFLCTKNDIEGFLVSVPNPENDTEYIDVNLVPSKDSKIKVDIINGSPYIKVDFSFTGRIYSMTEDFDFLDNTFLENISKSCNSYLKTTFTNYYYKTSKELNSDINGFGKFVLKHFSTITDFNDYNWNDNYKNSFFDVNVDTNVKSGFLLM